MMAKQVDHSRLTYTSFEEDRTWVDGHLFLPWFLENWDRYPWTDESLPKAWAVAWTNGSQMRQYHPMMEEAMMELLDEFDWNGEDIRQVMSTEEQERLRSLDYPVKVFRGINLASSEQLDMDWPGCCWTLSKDKAEWFAKRPGGLSALLELQIQNAGQVRAYLTEWGEEEIVIDCRQMDEPVVTWI